MFFISRGLSMKKLFFILILFLCPVFSQAQDPVRLQALITALSAKRNILFDAYLTKAENYNVAVDSYTANPTIPNLVVVRSTKAQMDAAAIDTADFDAFISNFVRELRNSNTP